MPSINGYLQQTRSSHPLRGSKYERTRTIVVDLYAAHKAIKIDKSLWLARQALSVREIMEGLIEEEISPREYPDIMDFICDFIDDRPELKDDICENTLDILSIQLEHHQLQIDAILNPVLRHYGDSYRYEVVRWLGDYSAVISFQSITPSILR